MAAADAEYRCIYRAIAENAHDRPDKTYLESVDDGRAVSYRELFATTNRLARWLADMDVGANDRAMLLAGNGIEQALAFLGILRHGACACTVNLEMNRRHLAGIVAAVKPRIVVYEEDAQIEDILAGYPGPKLPLGAWSPGGGSGLFGEIAGFDPADPGPARSGPDDDAVIFYTSGTDAVPKGVVYSHATLFHNTDAGALAMDLGERDKVLEFRSCAWVSAQEIGLVGPLIRGATAVLARRFSRSRYLGWIRDRGVTIGACVPAGINMLLAKPVDLRGADLPSLRYITSSSAPLLSDDMRAFERRYGIVVAPSFGASELGWVCGSNGADRKVGTVGQPTKHQLVEVVDESGAPLPPGAVGEIRVTSATQGMSGYLRKDGTVERTPPGPRMSGDLGFLDADGYLTITGRARDVIIRSGVNISPLEIDAVLAGHPFVAEACTIGVPEQVHGEAVVSHVVPAPGTAPTEEALREHCAARLPAAKVPARIVFRAALPRNDRGKLDRNALRAEWRGRNSTPLSSV